MTITAAALLLGLLLQRAGTDQHRIVLSDWCSRDWRSLTFDGERHCATFVVSGLHADELAARWVDGLAEADFTLARGFVGDIGLAAAPYKERIAALSSAWKR